MTAPYRSQINNAQRLSSVSKLYWSGSVGADTELTCPIGTGAAKPLDRPMAVRCESAGTLVVDYGGGVTDTLYFKAGERQEIQPAKIVASGSTAHTVTVYW